MTYAPRPGVSPAVATVLAAGLVRKTDRILEVGCGTGTDALALARFGCRVVGLDRDGRAVTGARSRARRVRLSGRTTFLKGDARQLVSLVGGRRFDVVVDTLFSNNLTWAGFNRYASQVATVAKPGALLVMQTRVWKRSHDRALDRRAPSAALARWFDFGPSVATAVPEKPLGPRDPAFARVRVSLGRRNREIVRLREVDP